MLKGFMQLKNVEPGSLIRFNDGAMNYAVVTEYGYDLAKGFDAYLLGTGEALATHGDVWVAVIDLEEIENEFTSETIAYPK